MTKINNQINSNVLKDSSRNTVIVGSAFQTKDSTASPIVSPKVVSTSVITLVVPDTAVFFTIYSLTNDCRVSEESTAAANYFSVKAGTSYRIPCGNMNNIYLLRDAGADATVQFMFETM